jgi:protein Mpv17
MKSLRSFCVLLLAGRCQAFSPVAQLTPQHQQELSPLRRQPVTPSETSYPHRASARRGTQIFSERVADQGEQPSSSNQQQDPLSRALTQQAARTERINQVVLFNGLVVGSLALSATYQLLHTHVEALLALYDYGLGKVDSPSVTYLTVTAETIMRMPFDLIGYYQQAVQSNPVFYKACTSGVAYCLGDFISQIYQGSTIETVDLPRSARSGAAGFLAHGPLCHYWLEFMETYLDCGGAWYGTGVKVTADLTLFAPILNAVYTLLISALAFRPLKESWNDVKITAWPALRSAWRFWPFVHTLSFSHLIPMDLKLLFVDTMEMVWVTILSKVANEDKNAQLESDPSLEFETVPPEDSQHYVIPELEIELTREEEQPAGLPLSFELPKQALLACWPLLAMWPFLYGQVLLERALTSS